MWDPTMRRFLSNKISMYFPKRLLLSFLMVLAFPKAFEKERWWGW